MGKVKNHKAGSWGDLFDRLVMTIKIRLNLKKTAKLTAKIEREIGVNDEPAWNATPTKHRKAPRLVWFNSKIIKGIIENILCGTLFIGACVLIIGFLGFAIVIFAGILVDMYHFFWNESEYFRIPLKIMAMGCIALVIAAAAMLIYEIIKYIKNLDYSRWWSLFISDKDYAEWKSDCRAYEKECKAYEKECKECKTNVTVSKQETKTILKAVIEDEDDDYDDRVGVDDCVGISGYEKHLKWLAERNDADDEDRKYYREWKERNGKSWQKD